MIGLAPEYQTLLTLVLDSLFVLHEYENGDETLPQAGEHVAIESCTCATAAKHRAVTTWLKGAEKIDEIRLQ